MNNLSIVTIGFKNDEDFLTTQRSIESIISEVDWIVQDGGGSFKDLIELPCEYVYQCDNGIFNAINLGISRVKTPYFMLLHSGDEFVGTIEDIQERIEKMHSRRLDLILGSLIINTGSTERQYNTGRWRPWHLKFGSQPAHLSSFYRTEMFADIRYNESNKVIGDFEFFNDLNWKTLNWECNNKGIIVRMGPGGNTSSGLSSLLLVTRSFIQCYGLFRGGFMALFRIPFKLFMSYGLRW